MSETAVTVQVLDDEIKENISPKISSLSPELNELVVEKATSFEVFPFFHVFFKFNVQMPTENTEEEI